MSSWYPDSQESAGKSLQTHPKSLPIVGLGLSGTIDEGFEITSIYCNRFLLRIFRVYNREDFYQFYVCVKSLNTHNSTLGRPYCPTLCLALAGTDDIQLTGHIIISFQGGLEIINKNEEG